MSPSPWRITATTISTAALGVALLLVGVVVGRGDLALLGAPLLLSTAWFLRRPSGAVVTLRARRPDGADLDRGEDASTELHAVLDLAHTMPLMASTGGYPPGSAAARLAEVLPPWSGPVPGTAARISLHRPGSRTFEGLVLADAPRALRVRTASVRTGRLPLYVVDHLTLGPGLCTATVSHTRPAEHVLVLPVPVPLPPLPAPFALRGLTGNHGSRRPGDGGELRDVHPFAAGDALRRIDWKVTARQPTGLSQPYVRRTFAMADAVVVLVVDSRDDAGGDVTTWSGFHDARHDEWTSLDVARRAAASFARSGLLAGDRVGLQDLGDDRRRVRPGAGQRHLERILHQLASAHPVGDPPERLRAPQLPSAAFAVLFSTFLDQDAVDVALRWRAQGHRVLAVDVLPPLRTAHLTAREWLALRIVRLDRTDRLASLVAAGVDLMAWQHDPADPLTGDAQDWRGADPTQTLLRAVHMDRRRGPGRGSAGRVGVRR